MKNGLLQNLDQTDRRILAILQADGKLSYQELGEAVAFCSVGYSVTLP